VKIYVVWQQWRRSGKRRERGWNSIYHQNWWQNLVWVSVISFSRSFIPSYVCCDDALLYWNWLFSPPNCVTLQISLL
jgi:hypothetical protein